MKTVSVIIPTFNRDAKLARCLDYIRTCFKDNNFLSEVFDFWIVDGSETATFGHSHLVREIEKIGVTVDYSHMPNEPLFRRVKTGVFRSSGDFIFVCGDDDLLDFDNVVSDLEEYGLLDAVVAGRFVNLCGLGWSNVYCTDGERPFSGFEIDLKSPLMRALVLGVSNGYGISSLSYSIIPRRVSELFYVEFDLDKQYYGGVEFMHQLFVAYHSEVIFTDKIHLFRDYSYIGYVWEDKREALDDEEFIYIGRSAVEALDSYFFREMKTSDREQMRGVVRYIHKIQQALGPSRQKLERRLGNPSRLINVMGGSRSAIQVNQVWVRHFWTCYGIKNGWKARFKVMFPWLSIVWRYLKIGRG